MKTWIITDTHFNHEKMRLLEGRPEHFTQIICKNWALNVFSQDAVIHLGDVILGRDSELEQLMANLPSRRIILTMGNHDNHSADWYMTRGFALACGYFAHKGILFSHEPKIPLPDGIRLNIHGHFHRNPVCFEQAEASEYYAANRDKYLLLHIEDTLSPVLLSTLLKGR